MSTPSDLPSWPSPSASVSSAASFTDTILSSLWSRSRRNSTSSSRSRASSSCSSTCSNRSTNTIRQRRHSSGSPPPAFSVLSPLSPRWSLAYDPPANEPERQEVRDPTMPTMPMIPATSDTSAAPAVPPSHVPLSSLALERAAASGMFNSASPRNSIMSVTSTVSFGSTASSATTTSTALRRFWTPSPSSPATSPSVQARQAWQQQQKQQQNNNGIFPIHRVHYIAPLIDTAGGTLPWQTAVFAPTSSSSFPILPALISPLIWSDICWVVQTAPEIASLLVASALRPMTALMTTHLTADAIAALEAVLQLTLATACLCTAFFWVPVLSLFLPGAIFAFWLILCLVSAHIASVPLQGGPAVSKPWEETAEVGMEEEDEKWFFVSGIGESSRSLAKTLPRLAAVFGRPINLIRPNRTYGVAIDLACVLLQRMMPSVLPNSGTDQLYLAVRQSLVADSSVPTSAATSTQTAVPRRVVILAHNAGAIDVSRVLLRLQADLPSAWLSRLEIYTFGSLAPDFVLQAGSSAIGNAGQTVQIEHFALSTDPCARFGVLRSIREHQNVRYCGGVFVLDERGKSAGPLRSTTTTATATATASPSTPVASGSSAWPISPLSHRSRLSLSTCLPRQSQNSEHLQHRRSTSASSWMSSRGEGSASQVPIQPLCQVPVPLHCRIWRYIRSLSVTPSPSSSHMEDYLTAMFGPEPWSMRPDMGGIVEDFSLEDSGFLDAAVTVDRDLAERREMQAMAGASGLPTNQRPKDTSKRLSWTGLGATIVDDVDGKTAKSKTTNRRPESGLQGLEDARRVCREYEGRYGRDVSKLAIYYGESVMRHEERFHRLMGLL